MTGSDVPSLNYYLFIPILKTHTHTHNIQFVTACTCTYTNSQEAVHPCSFRTNLTKVTFDKASHCGDVCYQGSSLLTFRRLESVPALMCVCFFLRQSLISSPELESPVDFSLPLCEKQLGSHPPHTLAGNSPVGGSRRASQPNPILASPTRRARPPALGDPSPPASCVDTELERSISTDHWF